MISLKMLKGPQIVSNPSSDDDDSGLLVSPLERHGLGLAIIANSRKSSRGLLKERPHRQTSGDRRLKYGDLKPLSLGHGVQLSALNIITYCISGMKGFNNSSHCRWFMSAHGWRCCRFFLCSWQDVFTPRPEWVQVMGKYMSKSMTKIKLLQLNHS